MREILFRGKRKDNGEWVYGDFQLHSLQCFIVERGTLKRYKVIPETVGQYTGLTDKNGTKIFEGDIVITNKFGTPQKKYVIRFDEKIATYIGEGKKECARYFTTFAGDADCFKVIGNIHDNPELLKGGVTDTNVGGKTEKEGD